ncbi:MAG: hypothetical protein NVS3B5_15700 [Sphingomicrobium sp.]
MIMKNLLLLSGAVAALGACNEKQPKDADNAATVSAPAVTKPAAAATRVRGVVQTVGENVLAVQTYDGRQVNVPIGANTKFAWVVGSSLATLQDGDFVGTATTGPDNALRAAELVIFPEAMRGTGEGHYEWDVPGVVAAAGGGGNDSSAMTNGTVQQQSAMTNGTVQQQSSMTNGTVKAGAGKPGETKLTIAYKGGTARVLVPAETPIVRFEPTARSVLTKGQKVFVVQAPDSRDAKFVAIGKDGLTPPM